MFRIRKLHRISHLALGLAVAIGLAIGLMAGGLWPQTSLHATATDRVDSFAIATGPVDDEVEAIYFLDFLSGDLRAMVLGKQVGGFCGLFSINAGQHLGVDPGKNPRYLMATGLVNLRHGGSRMQPSRAVVYVAEVTSGKVGAYAIPWNASMSAPGQKIVQNLVPVAMDQFRTPPAGGVHTVNNSPTK
jgi:hypothetical protein